MTIIGGSDLYTACFDTMNVLLYIQSGNLEDYNSVIKEEYKEEDEEYGVMKELFERHTDLCKDIMMEPPDYRNPPERCPRPLYSRDSTQEGHTIPPFCKVGRTEYLENGLVETMFGFFM